MKQDLSVPDEIHLSPQRALPMMALIVLGIVCVVYKEWGQEALGVLVVVLGCWALSMEALRVVYRALAEKIDQR